MDREPLWLEKRAILRLHREILAESGGSFGLRGEGRLDGALARARNLYSFRPHAGVAELAAAYGYGCLKTRPFTDGNRRVAFLAIGLFLAVNGYRITADPAEALRLMRSAPRELGTKDLAQWIAAHIERAA